MKRIIKIIILSCLAFMIVVVAGVSGYEARVYFENKELQNKIAQERSIRLLRLEKETLRMQAFAKETHSKCPSEVMLQYRGTGYKDIPAYPHLSAVYLHILPATHISGHARYRYNDYYPLTKQNIKDITQASDWKGDGVDTLSVKMLSGIMPSLFIKAIEQSLSYCGSNNKDQPLKVEIVDKIQHENLEKKDALTVIVAPFSYTEGSIHNPHISYPAFRLETSQYIPRWNVFSEDPDNKLYRSKLVKNDPFYITDLYARKLYELFSLTSPAKESVDDWVMKALFKWKHKNNTTILPKNLHVVYERKFKETKKPLRRRLSNMWITPEKNEFSTTVVF